MIIILLIIALIFIGIEFLLMASVISFFQKKFSFFDATKLLLAASIGTLVFELGIFIGQTVNTFYPEYSLWYAATLFFIFSLKMVYDGFKLSPIKRSVNPIQSQGFVVLVSFIGINGFFLGLGFGLLAITLKQALISILVFIIFSLVGYLLGFKLKKLNKGRYELLAAIFYLIFAIVLVINK